MDPVYKWISTNPHKHHLPTFNTTTNDDTEKEKWEGFQKSLLPLPGALSGILYCLDPMFRESTPSLQRQIMMEKILELQERVPNDLVGRRWSRKKILELLSAELAEKAPTTEVALEESLSIIPGVGSCITASPQLTPAPSHGGPGSARRAGFPQRGRGGRLGWPGSAPSAR